MTQSLPRVLVRPPHPERVCWGCDKHCPAHDLACGNGSERTLHPCELFGDDWPEWAIPREDEESAPEVEHLSGHRSLPTR